MTEKEPADTGKEECLWIFNFLFSAGILFSTSPTTLEQYNTTVSSARAFGSVGNHNDHDAHDHSGHDHSGHNDSSAMEPTETQHGPETQSDEANVQTVGLDENDMSMYGE